MICDARPYNTALISLDPDASAAFAAAHRIADTSITTLVTHPTIVHAVQSGIDRATSKLSRVEQIKKFAIVAEVWQPGGAYITPTGKRKRGPVATDFADAIDELYR
ncbi:long-chain fatty acid--CoA ligase [Mycobacteroides abscessus]|uniref:long-chain fatty acid--CoA ligase n=1 Tax=Mycobacteroides abscessus TaxID=36809 RepID=UPI0009C72AA2|nr:long-chain fatty acid--CoA ligase [Mycobacteroides abscessus]SKF98914.1 FadD11_2 [Mycobacteroides abscessus subsp. bolletii]SKG45282.1 FadD11_2 [Mycobacteroides abscessus subsp. bolletii]SKG79310.1 FadD11_2 [Mycobacteroides abscessus subsp. bolletii]SKH07028.1 FadD11_2 [Mycobacteroides abscessus subsp. bolletii]SKH78059.1 FadD11_2 [Mycobacteroides abscessus subsp. bolletii]